jgi:hypothetical protein
MNLMLIVRLLGILVVGMLLGIQISNKEFSWKFYLNVVIACMWFYLVLLG